MEKNDRKKWETDFVDFLSVPDVEVPASLRDNVVSEIGRDLNPSTARVFGRTLVIHAVSGITTLFFCPQFGVSFTSSMGIMSYLMKFGNSVCMAGCGALFTGLSLFFAALFLKPEEVRVLKKSEWLQIALVSSLSLGIFALMGGAVFPDVAIAWIIGAVLGGILLLEMGWNLRLRLRLRLSEREWI